MNQKGVGKVGIVITLIVGVSVGVIITQLGVKEGIIGTSNENSSGDSSGSSVPLLSIPELRANPSEYMGETIAVEGYYLTVGLGVDTMNNDPNSELISLKNADEYNMVQGGFYRATGELTLSDFGTPEIYITNVQT